MMEMRKRGVGVDKIVYGGDRLGSISWNRSSEQRLKSCI